jgi:hypothetical protein
MGPIEPKSENTQAKAHWFRFALRAVRRNVPLDPAAVVSSAAETAEGNESRCGEPTKFDDGIDGLLLTPQCCDRRTEVGISPGKFALSDRLLVTYCWNRSFRLFNLLRTTSFALAAV